MARLGRDIFAAASVAIALLASGVASYAQSPGQCLTSAAAREIVTQNKAIPPYQAMMAARELYPDHEMLRSRLCRQTTYYVYVVTALRPDGKVIRILVDATSGKAAQTR